MTLLDLLRGLVDGGIGLSIAGHALDVEGPADLVTPELVAAIRDHKVTLLRLLDPTALRVRLQLPSGAISPRLAVVMVRLAMERDAFIPDEGFAYDARVIDRQAFQELWLARLRAIEDVVSVRRSAR